jgi:tetratricopeptide (TPR) repeat protein
MRTMVVLGLLGLLALPAAAQGLEERFAAKEREAFEAFAREEWETAIRLFEEQIAIYADNPRPYYNIACAYARRGDADRACTWIQLAIARGWRHAEHFRTDPDLDTLRGTTRFAAVERALAEACRTDPDAQPRTLPLSAVEPAASAREALAADALAIEIARRTSRSVVGTHEYLRRYYTALDRRMARLTRYLAEHGDARDAHTAAAARVDTAAAYAGAEPEDPRTIRIADGLTETFADHFLARYAGGDLLPLVRFHLGLVLARAAGRREEAVAALQALVADHPDFPGVARAKVEGCALLARAPVDRGALTERFTRLGAEAAHDEDLAIEMRLHLMEARFLVEGVPVFDGVTPAPGAPRAYAFVLAGDPRSEAALAGLRGRDVGTRILVTIARPEDGRAEVNAWLGTHARESDLVVRAEPAIVGRLWLNRIPVVVLTGPDGRVQSIE